MKTWANTDIVLYVSIVVGFQFIPFEKLENIRETDQILYHIHPQDIFERGN